MRKNRINLRILLILIIVSISCDTKKDSTLSEEMINALDTLSKYYSLNYVENYTNLLNLDVDTKIYNDTIVTKYIFTNLSDLNLYLILSYWVIEMDSDFNGMTPTSYTYRVPINSIWYYPLGKMNTNKSHSSAMELLHPLEKKLPKFVQVSSKEKFVLICKSYNFNILNSYEGIITVSEFKFLTKNDFVKYQNIMGNNKELSINIQTDTLSFNFKDLSKIYQHNNTFVDSRLIIWEGLKKYRSSIQIDYENEIDYAKLRTTYGLFRRVLYADTLFIN